ncbi:rCG36701, partial [Rattus norvegicus]
MQADHARDLETLNTLAVLRSFSGGTAALCLCSHGCHCDELWRSGHSHCESYCSDSLSPCYTMSGPLLT